MNIGYEGPNKTEYSVRCLVIRQTVNVIYSCCFILQQIRQLQHENHHSLPHDDDFNVDLASTDVNRTRNSSISCSITNSHSSNCSIKWSFKVWVIRFVQLLVHQQLLMYNSINFNNRSSSIHDRNDS